MLRVYCLVCVLACAMACSSPELVDERTDVEICAQDDRADACQAACALPHAGSCMTMAEKHLLSRGAAFDPPLAHTFLIKACDAGEVQGCADVAAVYATGDKVPEDAVRARTYAGRACMQHDHQASCILLADLYLEGRGGAASLDDARGVLEKVCVAPLAPKCVRLGAMYVNGEGGDVDPEKAAALFENACSSGDMPACAWLGDLYYGGVGVPRDYGRAKVLFESACTAKERTACFGLGAIYEQGLTGAQNAAIARDHYKTACDLGLQKACDRL